MPSRRSPANWLLLPSYEIRPPPDGPLQLGGVITNPQDPLRTLVKIGPIEVQPTSEIQRNFSENSESVHKRLFGLLGTQHSITELRIEKLVTLSFTPRKEYLDAAFGDPELQRFVKAQGKSRNPKLYLITGLKIATGLSFEERKGKKLKNKSATVGLVDLAAPGVLAGVNVTVGRESEQGTSFIGSSDILFAIQVVKIKYYFPAASGEPWKSTEYQWKTAHGTQAFDGETKPVEGTPGEIIPMPGTPVRRAYDADLAAGPGATLDTAGSRRYSYSSSSISSSRRATPERRRPEKEWRQRGRVEERPSMAAGLAAAAVGLPAGAAVGLMHKEDDMTEEEWRQMIRKEEGNIETLESLLVESKETLSNTRRDFERYIAQELSRKKLDGESGNELEKQPSKDSSVAPGGTKYRVLRDHAGTETQATVKAGDLITIIEKEDNGWWLAKTPTGQGYVLSAYLKKEALPSTLAGRPSALMTGDDSPIDGNSCLGDQESGHHVHPPQADNERNDNQSQAAAQDGGQTQLQLEAPRQTRKDDVLAPLEVAGNLASLTQASVRQGVDAELESPAVEESPEHEHLIDVPLQATDGDVSKSTILNPDLAVASSPARVEVKIDGDSVRSVTPTEQEASAKRAARRKARNDLRRPQPPNPSPHLVEDDSEMSDHDSTPSAPRPPSPSCGISCFGAGTIETEEQRKTREKQELAEKTLEKSQRDLEKARERAIKD